MMPMFLSFLFRIIITFSRKNRQIGYGGIFAIDLKVSATLSSGVCDERLAVLLQKGRWRALINANRPGARVWAQVPHTVAGKNCGNQLVIGTHKIFQIKLKTQQKTPVKTSTGVLDWPGRCNTFRFLIERLTSCRLSCAHQTTGALAPTSLSLRYSKLGLLVSFLDYSFTLGCSLISLSILERYRDTVFYSAP